MTSETVSTVDVGEIRRRQAEKWAEIQRIAQLCATKKGIERHYYLADLLVELGAVTGTPDAKAVWRNGLAERW